MDIDLRASAVGFLVALVVLAGILVVVGVGEVVDALLRAEPSVLVAVVAVATVWLSAWGLSLRTVLRVLGARVAAPVSVGVFAAATFANNVTPFGQAGGEPVSALLISRAADTEYESSLAAIASVDSLNFVPSIALASLGIAYFSTQVAFGSRLRFAALAVGALALAVPVAAVVGWRYRYRVERAAVSAVTPLIRAVGRVVPGRSPPGPSVIRGRVEGFFHAIERVTADRKRLTLALGFSALGWLCLAASLWLSLFSLGQAVSFAVVLVVVPVGAIAGITPLPGGLGGVEAVLIALLVALGVPGGAATAAVVIHRTATYWLPTVVGGGVAGIIGSNEGLVGVE
ncbi:lysylphosphatidylglycerol synthase transmembrane domain-containing protein [Halorarius halobius]|uniref:lysylphosphatidylglycerol synthase transmembrane domain-containing protein n=1 Tax=Halorarius halobius TaxID=2962671 RepID=UPI0020CBC8D4|nr:lysylphosphatidylglycerol synthase transmembrane domain-containing protein [Halorarius halobius]